MLQPQEWNYMHISIVQDQVGPHDEFLFLQRTSIVCVINCMMGLGWKSIEAVKILPRANLFGYNTLWLYKTENF